MGALSGDNLRAMVESARDEALSEHCGWNLVVNCEPSVSISWPRKRLDVLALELL